MLNSRQENILRQLRVSGHVEVDVLAQVLEVTPQTIRRDLFLLCNQGLATRIHGGARRAISTSIIPYEDRRHSGVDAKRIIAHKATELIPNGSSLALNIGTTTEQVADALKLHKELTIISNNINIVHILQATSLKALIIVGGEVRLSDGAIVGIDAIDAIGKYKVDYAIIGASSLDNDGSILDFDRREVAVARAILANARTKILVCDNSKFEVSASNRICDIGDLDYFVTNFDPPLIFQDVAQKAGTKIIIADSSDSGTYTTHPISLAKASS